MASVLLIVTRDDDTEECYDVPPRTSIRAALREDVYVFRTTTGGQIAFAKDSIRDMRLGNVEQTSSPHREGAD